MTTVKLLKIGQVATQLRLNPKTIRYYEEIGLIPPLKRTDIADLSSNGNRLFSEQDVRRLELIKKLKPLDLSLAQIKEILDSLDEGCCTIVRPQAQIFIADKLKQVDKRIEDLKSLRMTLEMILQSSKSAKSDSKDEISCGASNDPCQCALGVKGHLIPQIEGQGIPHPKVE